MSISITATSSPLWQPKPPRMKPNQLHKNPTDSSSVGFFLFSFVFLKKTLTVSLLFSPSPNRYTIPILTSASEQEGLSCIVFFLHSLNWRRQGFSCSPFFFYTENLPPHSRMQIFCSHLFGFYFAAVLALVGFPSILDHSPDVTLHLVPLAGIPADFQNACLNVLLFVPLGLFLPLLWDSCQSLRRTLLFALCVTLFIELSQLFTLRATDINDILTNLAGAAIGYFLAKQPQKSFLPAASPNGKEPILLCTITARGVLFRPAVCFRLLLGTPAVAHILLFNTFTTASFNMINPSVFKKILVFFDALILADLLIKRKILGNL